ncbi:MAG TPA: serine--tRNA ligase, partial [Acidimicrobiia bacterium]|nr:serine--tRNA ligase [Acidimicrobiia bacterium]
MIDLRALRDEPDYRSGILRKGADGATLDALLEADDRRRALRAEVEELRARQNAASKEIGKASPEERPAKIEAAGRLKEELAAREPELTAADDRVRDLLVQVPCPAAPDVPDGGEDDFEVVRTVGDPVAKPPLDHHDYGRAMGFVDQEQAAEISGSRFVYLMREAVL